jgi:hypothetical protein
MTFASYNGRLIAEEVGRTRRTNTTRTNPPIAPIFPWSVLNDTNPNTLAINESTPIIQRKASGLETSIDCMDGETSTAIRINTERQNSANDIQPMSCEERIIFASG